VGRHPDHTMAPFAAGVNPVRNSSGALNPAGIILKSNPAAEQWGIISNGVKNKDLPPIYKNWEASLISYFDLKHIHANNPLTLLEKRGISRLPHWIYFDYGEKEGFQWITEGNQNFEKALKEKSHWIPLQPFNGKSGHSYIALHK